MLEDCQFAHGWEIVAVGAAALVAECGIVFGALAPGLAWWVPLTAHLITAAGLAAWYRWSPRHHSDARLTLLLAAGTAALGPAGAAGTS